MSTKQEIMEQLGEMDSTITQIGTETTASLERITELESMVSSNAGLDEIAAKVAEIKTRLKAVDDLVKPADAGGDDGEGEETPV